MIQDFPRALKMLERTLDGASFSDCVSEFGVSRQRVSMLVRWTCRILLSPERLGADPVPEHDIEDLTARRAHADFWRAQIRKVSSAPHE